MPKKKSVKLVAGNFRDEADRVEAFAAAICAANLSKEQISWGYEYAAIRLYRAFEIMMLEVLIGAINNDASTVATHVSISFPKHMSDDVCEFLITGGGYFDFKGRSHLIKECKRFLPETHYLVSVLKDTKYKEALERLSALRNFAAHNSWKSKVAAKEAVGVSRLASTGAWLKKGNRLHVLSGRLKALATDLETQAPY